MFRCDGLPRRSAAPQPRFLHTGLAVPGRAVPSRIAGRACADRRPPGTQFVRIMFLLPASSLFFGERPGSEVHPRAGPDTLAGRSNCRPGLRAQRRRPTFRAFRPCPRPRPGPPHTGETPAAGEGRRGRPRRGAGAVERGGLENRCAPCVPWVRIPPSPPRLVV